MKPAEFSIQNLPPECFNLIRQWEREELTAYLDPIGIPSIGYGHTGGVTMADVQNRRTITHQEAERLLMEDVGEALSIAKSSVYVDLTPYQMSAIVSFIYNVGHGRKATETDKGKDGFVILKNGSPSTMRRKLNEGDYNGAVLEFPKWIRAGGVVLNGLVSRRTQEAALFTREYVVNTSPQPAPTHPKIDPPLVNQPSSKPTRKWKYGALGGGMVGLISFMVVVYWNTKFPENQLPAEYVAALPTFLTYVGVLFTQYMTKNRATDVPPG